MAERPLTLGTAGHIDHGKTTLIKALTGRDTDRLKEEKERGISIELGYAELTLPGGRHLSVVDVPGHERFVKTMVSGATGIDLFLLVVAADDGVMPQTREHLRIIELLGIPTGLVALTKIDMVDPDMVELATADIEEFLASTRYAEAPVVPVSGVTGEGLPELLAALDRLGDQVPERLAYPATRMPVDRVFSLKGIGTVITGTLWSGAINAEDTVAILPPRPGRGSTGLRDVRVRSIQVHDREVAEAAGGQRVALNLTGVDRDEVDRGQWVVKDPTIEPTYLADVRLTLLPGAAGPLARVSQARVDHGTAEILAKIVLADCETLEPGQSCCAQVRFEERVLVYPGDQFILRSVTPVTTIGGGRVIDPASHKHGTGRRWHDRLVLLEEGVPGEVAALLLEEAFPSALTRGRLEASPYLWRSAAKQIGAAVAGLLGDGRALPAVQQVAGAQPAGGAGAEPGGRPAGPRATGAAGPNVRLFHGPLLLALTDRTLQALRDRAGRDALNPYLTLGELRRELAGGKEWPALDAALERLQASGDVVRTEHGYRWAEAPVAGGAESETVERLLAQFTVPGTAASAGTVGAAETPSVALAAEAAGLAPREAQKMVDALVRQGRLVRVGEDLYYPPDRLQDLLDRLAGAMEQAGQLTLAEARDLLGTSRRYSQALLEHMDSEGLTLRVGEARRLRRRRH
ncbi:MAG: selenocysteine-specific translation elongation factor [Thermoleophilia bacterium]|nr:selenocysteine-specific translation elongation factor [Thermoleophilia bacterium]